MLDGGGVTIGVLATFVFYLQSFFDPIQSLSQLYTTYQAGMAALDKIFELLDEEPDIADKPTTDRAAARAREIRFEDVTFSYGGDAPALDHVSWWCRPETGARGRHRRRQVDAREARRASTTRTRARADRRPTCAT